MICSNPFVKSGQAFGCGQCLPCRHHRARVWAHRLILETKDHASSVFATLTYSDENLPPDGNLQPAHSRNFLKRLRKSMEPERLRYFLVGEYGDKTQRPHYHAALFNYPQCEFGGSRYSDTKINCCPHCDLIRSTWSHGHIYLGELTPESASYVCGYVTKKLTSKKQDAENGRLPEFHRQSNRPGIGANLMDDVASSLLYNPGVLAQLGDVPSSLRHGSTELPLGRYLKRRLRQRCGLSPDAPKITLEAMAQKLHLLRSYAFENSLSFKNTLVEASLGKRTNLLARARVRKKARPI